MKAHDGRRATTTVEFHAQAAAGTTTVEIGFDYENERGQVHYEVAGYVLASQKAPTKTWQRPLREARVINFGEMARVRPPRAKADIEVGI